MKRYLQPCNMNGSLYGKKDRRVYAKQTPAIKPKEKKDLVNSYEELYKTQYVAMAKLFNKAK